MSLSDGGPLVGDRRDTLLPEGFSGLRVVTNSLHCAITLWLPIASGEPAALCVAPADAVQLLCRALRLAPRCYRQFELRRRAGDRNERGGLLAVYGCVKYIDSVTGRRVSQHDLDNADFDSLTDLASAMQQLAAADHLIVQLSQHINSIVVRRVAISSLLAVQELQ